MSGLLIRKAIRKSLTQVQHVYVVPAVAARDLVAAVYSGMERDFGMLAAPVVLHSAAPELLAASWAMLRETLVAGGSVDRTAKEAIATWVSLANACQYCVDVHITTMELLNEHRDAAPDADDAAIAVADRAVRAVSDWARASGTSAGAARHGFPFPAGHLPELVGTAVSVHYLNRMVNVFLPETSATAGITTRARAAALRLFGRSVLLAACRPAPPGASVPLLPDAPLPPDLAWAAGNPTIAAAFARAAAAIEAAATRSVPDAVRILASSELSNWEGEHSGVPRDRLETMVAALPAADRPAGRLALLTALAPHQVDASLVADFRLSQPDDRALIELTSWASMAAARRVGTWIALDPTTVMK